MSVSMGARTLVLLSIGMVGSVALSLPALGADATVSPASAPCGPDLRVKSCMASGSVYEDPHGRLIEAVMEVHAGWRDLHAAFDSLDRFVRAHPDDSEASEHLERLRVVLIRGQGERRRWNDLLPMSRDPAETDRNLGDVQAHLSVLSHLLVLVKQPEMMSPAELDGGLWESASIRGAPGTAEESDAERERSSHDTIGSIPAGASTTDAGLPAGAVGSTSIPLGSELQGSSGSTTDGPAGALPGTSGTTAGSTATGTESFALPSGPSGRPASTGVAPPLPETAKGYLRDLKNAITNPSPPTIAPRASTPDRNTSTGAAGGAPTRSWGRIALVSCAVVVGLLLWFLAIRMLLRQIDSGGKVLQHRLRRAAAPLAGPAAGETRAEGQQSIFRKTERRSRIEWLRRPIESRYTLLDARRAFPVSVGAGLAAAAFAWASISFLKMPVGGWTLPVCGIVGVGGLWYAFGWQQARQEAAFVRQFPEVVDQIVRLAGAGVPSVEALTVVAADAPQPIRPILDDLCDSLLAGIDTDVALRMATERTKLAEFTMFAAVIRLQRRSGGGISTAFANLSKTLRERHKTALKAHASTAQSRLTLLVLSVMPVLVLLGQKFTSPASVEILFGTEQGTTLLQVGTGLIVVGLLVARAIAARAAR